MQNRQAYEQSGLDKSDNTFLLSQLGGQLVNLGPHTRALDGSQLNLAGKAAFGADVSNILGPPSDHMDKSGLIGNADMSKFFVQANDKSMSMLLKQ